MPYKFHTIAKYHYSLTLSNNDYAAKGSLWNDQQQKVADLYFMYEGTTPPACTFNDDQTFAVLYLPFSRLNYIIDLLRNEQPVGLTLNPPFAFLGVKELEPTGEGE